MTLANQPPVLIIGGSLVGLTASLALTTAGIPNITFEKHAQISAHPRAMGFTPRTMEYYRSLGIADQIPQAPADFTLLRARRSAQSPTNPQTPPAKPTFSSLRGAAIPQDALETILSTTALSRGADIRRGWTVLTFTQTPTGVTITVLPPCSKTPTAITGSYLLAADGHRSTIRGQLATPLSGIGHMQTMRSVLFRADLSPLTSDITQFEIDQPESNSLHAFLTTYNDHRWVLMFYDDIHRSEPDLRSAINLAIGRDDIPVHIITTGRWDLTARIAERFHHGRVFLLGDAAHTLPPNRGGYGRSWGEG
ncbi:FAD-binding monooxygenase [Aspergillus ellipticus CBS 707.79]|uniref:FAD-binding monooxygenase n=1 Tax=Aspergillus ellipticus CBS 707.79 TaxID=1448320 RepID=A0A319DJ33_9EURO|nr:FAD-binding monooxygenase [Aspergillus ellipticus CBS 707.79]